VRRRKYVLSAELVRNFRAVCFVTHALLGVHTTRDSTVTTHVAHCIRSLTRNIQLPGCLCRCCYMTTESTMNRHVMDQFIKVVLNDPNEQLHRGGREAVLFMDA